MSTNETNIQVQCLENIHNTSTLVFTSGVFKDIPKLTLNIENVRTGTYQKGISYYCVTEKFVTRESDGVLNIDIEGLLCLEPKLLPGPNIPYTLKMRVVPEPYRVSIESELAIDSAEPLFSYEPCLQSSAFSTENHPAFEMARKSFGFFKDKGFRWLSDVERFRAEYQDEPYKEGPWIQRFTTEDFTCQGESALLAPVGWVSDDNSHIIATASDNPYELGIRWGPCLHSNIAAPSPDAKSLSAKTVVYILPADLQMLTRMFQEDFPYASDNVLTSQPAIWATDKGVLLDSLEDADLGSWVAAGSTLGPYRSNGNWTNGNLHMVLYPEGVTDGKGSALWDIPAGQGDAAVIKSLAPYLADHPDLSHIAFDVMDRGADVTIEAFVRYGDTVGFREQLRLHPMSTRRVVLPINGGGSKVAGEATFGLRVAPADKPAQIIIDNLRGFTNRG